METKSFVLRRDNHASIVKLIGSDTIAVVRPEKYVENLFRELIHRTIVEKKSGKAELESVLDYFRSISSEAAYLEKVDEFEQMVKAYLSEGMFVYAPLRSVEDYLLARCARLCAEAVACGVKGSRVIDGTGLVVCRPDGVFDWAVSREAIKKKKMQKRAPDRLRRLWPSGIRLRCPDRERRVGHAFLPYRIGNRCRQGGVLCGDPGARKQCEDDI